MAQKLFIISLLFLSIIASSNSEVSESVSPNDIFSDAMVDDFASRNFQNLQWSFLNTPGDSSFLNFFSQTEELLPIFTNVRDQLNTSLDQFSLSAQVSMLRLGPGLTTQYTLIDDMVRDLAHDLGFSGAAIRNREVYIAAGGMNAFTVSGNKDRIIVVLQSDLISKMNVSEIKAVLAHEMGHIRSMHSSVRFMHTLMLDLVARQFGVTDLVESDGGKSFDLNKVCSHQKAIDDGNVTQGEPFSFSSLLTQGQMALTEVSVEQRASLAKDYLQHLIINLREADALPQVQTYFTQLMMSIGNGVILKIDAEQLDQNAEAALAAISRNNEKSADRYATSVVPNAYVGSAFLKLVGIDFEPDERDLFLKQILEAAKDFYNKVPEQTRGLYVGTTHPSLNLRIAGVLQEEAYPSILFANPFLRIMLLEESLRAEISTNEPSDEEQVIEHKENMAMLKSIQTRIVGSVAALGFASKVNPRFENAIQYFSLGREALLRRLTRATNMEVSEEAGVTEEDKAFMIKLLKFNLEKENTLALELLKAIKAQYESTEVEVTEADAKVLRERIAMLNAILSGQDADQLMSVREDVTHPTKQGNSRRIPVQIDYEKCALLLTAPKS